MTSRQRLLSVLNHETPDHVPCSFMLFNALKSTCRDYREFLDKQIQMGLDTIVQLPPRQPIVNNDWYNLHGLPVSFSPEVKVVEWSEKQAGEQWNILVKEYQTPAGTLQAQVRQDPEWRWGNHVPLFDDYLETRSKKFIIGNENDLAAFQYLLLPPTAAEIETFIIESKPYMDFAHENQLLISGGWGVGVDLLGWVLGLQNMIYVAHDQPVFLQNLLDMITVWNQNRMSVILDSGVDLYIKRAWYENCDFWSPRLYRKFVAPILAAETALAHQHGAKFGLIITSNCMPLLNILAECGVDVLIGVDPLQWDLEKTRQILGDRVSLWGGVNGHLTVEMGSPNQVREEVRTAMKILSPGNHFILSPVDNIRQDTPTSRENIAFLLNEWHNLV